MPIEIAEAFGQKPVVPGTPTAAPVNPDEPGLDIKAFFDSQPKPLTLKDKAAAAAKAAADAAKKAAGAAAPVVKKALGAVAWEGKGLEAGLTDATRQIYGALDQIKEDLQTPGAESMPLHGLKTAWDTLNAIWAPASSAVDVAVTQPIQKLQEKVGDFLDKYGAEDTGDMQARQEGQRGQEYPKGVDWKIHKADIHRTVESLQEQTSAAVQALLGLVGAKGVEHVPERAAAEARLALRDMKEVVSPREPELVPISVSLDKSMGFQKVIEVVAPMWNGLQPGSTITAAGAIDTMLPHAKGYAKSFLEKLQEHVDPTLPIRFEKRAGQKPETLGIYTPALHAIEIKLGEHDVVQTTVHEMVHSATVNMLDTLIEADVGRAKTAAGRELTAEEALHVMNNPSSPVIKELDQIIKEARVRAQKAGREFYALKKTDIFDLDPGSTAYVRMSPRYEFVAELFSNPDLQEFLANSEKYASAGYRFKNMLNQLGILIGKHLGIDKPQELQLLNQSLKVGTQLIKMQATEKPPTGRSILEVVGRTRDGEDITRGDIKRATQLEVGRLIDRGGARRAKTSLQISVEQLLRTFNPEALGRNAKLGAAAIASRITEQMQKESMWRYGSRTRLKFWRARPDFTKEFIERFEKGENFSDPILRDLARRYKAWGQKVFEHDQKLGLDYEQRDNYLYHAFEDSEGVANYFTRKYGSKWGDPGLIKERTFNLYKEAIAAGFRPRFDNPEDIMLARQHASDIAEMHVGIMNDLASYGLATRKIVGGEKLVKSMDAEGKMRFDIVKTEANEQPVNTVRWRSPNGDVFWVDSQADAILQNAFKSKSLWEDRGLIGVGFRGMMSLKNALVPIRLALSLFHPLHVMGIDMAAGMTRALTGITSNPLKSLGEMLSSGLLLPSLREMPVARSLTGAPGWRIMNAWRGKIPKEKLSANDAKALETLIEMGVAPEMSSQYRSNARQNFSNALIDARASFRQVKPIGLAGDLTRATWHLPWALISAMSKPVFEEWIPQLKAASALKDAKNLLQRNPELVENDAARHMAMRKLGKSVENRYGEMNYSTLFWKRWMKDIAVLDTLSLGWQLGFLREYGGGAMDLGQWAMSGNKLQRIRQGQLDRAIFVSAYTTIGAGVAGMMTWAMTGEQPKDLLDYVSPRTGEKNPDGTDQRVSTMFYSREFAALYKHIQNEGVVPGVSQLVLNKGSGLFGLMHEWATGVNGFGQEIRDPDGDAFQKVEQTLAYSLSDLEPISMKAIHDSVSEKPLKAGVLSVLGFTPAPKYLTESKTEADIKTAFRSYVAPKETPYERAEYSKEYTQLREAYQTGSDKYGDLMDKMVERYEMSATDQRRLIRGLNSTLPAPVRMFMRLPWQEQRKILDRATPEERDLLLPHSNREHVRNVWTPPE